MTGNRIDEVLNFWDDRAGLLGLAGTNDYLAKQLEINTLLSYMQDGLKIIEVGCGNGLTAIEIASRFDVDIDCYDFSKEMIANAKKLIHGVELKGRVNFFVGDVREMPSLQSKYDVAITERVLINLSSWGEQCGAVKFICSLLNGGGRYLMMENSLNGLLQINKFRSLCGLEAIEAPWHNLYIDDELIANLEVEGAVLAEVNGYSSSYYFLSRVVNAWLAKKSGAEPSYDADVNKLALLLPAVGDFSQGKLWVWRKK